MSAKPKITEDEQFKIEKMLFLWEGKLTWSMLTQKIKIELGMKISRQTLTTYKGIYNAYSNKKELYSGKTHQVEKRITQSDVTLVKQLENLQAEIELKNKTINEQKRFLQRILQNAIEIPALKGNLDILIAERPEDK
ncbi:MULTISPECIES: hypothetical protein [Pseudoalteromonas]|uniref:hypothetical protein n=1 Tax=Pseudoalteromonas TaxID=53246 RepID=UPI001230AE81|nr:hypothetical protein [Pseudoalteromonas rhizosphaerae]